jgi:hypothetical protein
VTLSFEETEEELKVTKDHGLLVWRGNDGGPRLYQAKSVEVGEKLLGVNGERTVKKVELSQGSRRAVLKTRAGTVIASGTVATTICGEYYEEGSDFEETRARWMLEHASG